jgi:hypothetical protein
MKNILSKWSLSLSDWWDLFKSISFPFLLLIILILLIKGCQDEQDKKRIESQLKQFDLVNQNFENKILQDSSTISLQKQTILTQEIAIKNGLLKLNEIKKAQSQVREVQKIRLDTVFIGYQHSPVDTMEWVKKIQRGERSARLMDSIIKNSVIVPREFKTENKWYSISGKVKKDGVLMDSIKLENESSVTIGYKKYGFLKLKKEPIVEIHNTNPYLKVSKLNNVVIKENSSVFKSKTFWLGLGTLIGIAIKTL